MHTWANAAAPESLCLFRLSAIGDCCHMVPVVRSLQHVWPDTRLTWIIGQPAFSLLGDIPEVEFIRVDKASPWKNQRSLREALRGRQFDALLLMQVSLRAGLISTAIKAPIRIGFDRDRARDGHGFFINRRIAPNPRAHVLDGFFDFLRSMGIEQRILRWDIPIRDAAREKAAVLIPDHQACLIISPCSSQRFRNFRNWPARHYAAVARHAFEMHGMSILLTGGQSEEERLYGEEITRMAGVPVNNLIGKTGLKELLALLSRASALLSPDSGPAHMATAVGTPVLGLFATSNPARTGPYLDRRWIIDRYPAAVKKAFGKNIEDIAWGRRVRDPDAMDLIEVVDVTQRLDSLRRWQLTGATGSD